MWPTHAEGQHTMRSHTILLMIVLIAGCLTHGTVSELQHVRSLDESAYRLRGRPVDHDESVRRRYEEARQLAREALRSRTSRDLDVRGSRVRDGAIAEDWGLQMSSSSEKTCDVFTLTHLDECACYYAKRLRLLSGEQEEYCKTKLHEDFDIMEGGCSFFVDIGGRFKISILGKKMQEALQSCSALGINSFSLGTGSIQAEDRQGGFPDFPCSGPICDLLEVLQKMVGILKDIYRKTPTPTPSNRRRMLVADGVQKGYSPRVARLMAYNNMSVVPASQSL